MTAKMPTLFLRNNKRGNMATQSNLVKHEDQLAHWEIKMETWSRTYMKGASKDELELFANICQRTHLSPEMKQIYPVPRWDAKLGKEVFSFQVSIDGFRLIAERTGRYAPGRENTYTYNDKDELISATAFVKKQTADGTWHEVAYTAFFKEYVQLKKDGTPSKFWKDMEHVMLGKCAESCALRKAFPADLSGLYTVEEMSQAKKIGGDEPANTLEEAIAIDVCQKSEEDLLEQFYSLMKDAPERENISVHLNFCFSNTKKSKIEFLEGCINSPDAYLHSYKSWLANKNAAKV